MTNDGATDRPTVTVVIPTYREAEHIDATLDSVTAQTYDRILEILVVDGGSDDDTTTRAAAHTGVTVLHNPDRIQAAALNIGIGRAKGDVIVRVDGHCRLAPDYVEQCVRGLIETGAAMVGGAMTPVAEGTIQEGIAAAMASPFGAGPARFHTGGDPGWVDTVYLGAYWTNDARDVDGYATDMTTNEDAEFAHRLATHTGRGIRFDPAIRSTYTPRSSFRTLAEQFHRYGRGRAITMGRHPESISPRQFAAPALVLGLASPLRRPISVTYAAVVGIATLRDGPSGFAERFAFAAALPTMHLAWGTGLLRGIVSSTIETARVTRERGRPSDERERVPGD